MARKVPQARSGCRYSNGIKIFAPGRRGGFFFKKERLA
jgi:hypothetical protein